MLGKLTGWDDTIVALATPPGVGALGIIRISGPTAWSIVARLFRGKDLERQQPHTLHVGMLAESDELLDEVVVSLYRGPRSYTGEDVVELSCHGSPVIQERVILALLNLGARLARPGEFTQRAFLNGKLDLTQAEGVADLIASNSSAAARAALHTVRGGFSRALKELRDQLLSFSALIELELDFSQEDVEFADRGKLYGLIRGAQELTGSLIHSFRLGNVIRNGVQVAIIGKPNAGKSTLLNELLNENRAIVSEIAGTTRDTIEEAINIGGVMFRLIDTAGIRGHGGLGVGSNGKMGEERGSAAGGFAAEGTDEDGPAAKGDAEAGAKNERPVDAIEAIGIEKSIEKMAAADIVVYLFDVADPVREIAARRAELVAAGKTFLLVINKVDTVGEDRARELYPGELLISAKEHLHIDELKQRLVDLVMEGKADTEGTIVTNARHFEALKEVAGTLGDVVKGLDEKLSGDLLALDVRRCLHYLGEITGEVTSEERLGVIFGKFCIGK
jgi:tRNA modification GTPase